MLDPIRSFFQRNIAIEGNGQETAAAAEASRQSAADRKLHIAACALLLELAHADDEFSDDERNHIAAVLQRHFALDEGTAEELMQLAEAERSKAIDLFQFTNLIRNSYDLGQKTLLAEIMWGLVMADGAIARHEAFLLRRIAGLLDLETGYLAHAKSNAKETLH